MEGILNIIQTALSLQVWPDHVLKEIMDLLYKKANSPQTLQLFRQSQLFEKNMANRLAHHPTLEEAVVTVAFLVKVDLQKTRSLICSGQYENEFIQLIEILAGHKIHEIEDFAAFTKQAEYISDFLHFIILCLNSPPKSKLNQYCTHFISLPLCLHFSKASMKHFLIRNTNCIREWKKMINNAQTIYSSSEANFLPMLLKIFSRSFAFISSKMELDMEKEKLREISADEKVNIELCQRLLELLIALIQNVDTSIYIKAFLEDTQLLTLLRLSKVMDSTQGALIDKQRDLLKFYMGCSKKEKEEKWIEENEKLGKLFQVLYKNFGDKFKKSSTQFLGKLNSRENLEELLRQISEEESLKLCEYLEIPLPSIELMKSILGSEVDTNEILGEIVKSHFDDKDHAYTEIVDEPIYPTEEMIWDVDEIPYKCKEGSILAFPHLGTSYANLEDYLSRVFWLYRLDATYHIREDLENAIVDLREGMNSGSTSSCIPIKRFAVVYVKPPLVGMTQPAEVRAEIEYSLQDLNEEQKKCWQKIKRGEVLFLASFSHEKKADSSRKTSKINMESNSLEDASFPKYIKTKRKKEIKKF